MSITRNRAWALFDVIVESAPLREASPWLATPEGLRFEPDYETLQLLLGVPLLLGASSQSGVPALAVDVWVSHELRRAGFEADRVWPRPVAPRVLPREIIQFIAALPRAERDRLNSLISRRGTGGSSSANVLGKNYVKQVDVVMSSWATGPELLISTKRMDSSFGKNAANRVEESYGDAKNLRLRHPRAALGFMYSLGSLALVNEPAQAEWLMDLLAKLGREDDAYDAVGLIIPEIPRDAPPGDDMTAPAGPLDAGADVEPAHDSVSAIRVDMGELPRVHLRRDAVPSELDPGRFFGIICRLLLERTPVTFHSEARKRLAAAENPVAPS